MQGKATLKTGVLLQIWIRIWFVQHWLKQPAVNNEYVDAVIEAITTVAQKDGDKGRGKIFILPIEECIRIRTGERGSVAIG
jgi:nitrogen regulatory protein PII